MTGRAGDLALDPAASRLLPHLRGHGAVVTTRSPVSGEVLAELATSTARDVEDAFARARAAQPRWAGVPVTQRARVLSRFHDLLLERQDDVAAIIQAEAGKTRVEAGMECLDVAGLCAYYARRAHRLLAPKRRQGAIPMATQTWERRPPKGVVALISPFNYPLTLGVGDAVPALVAGNAIVHKPDHQGALTALWARELLVEAGLPDDVYTVVVGEPELIGNALVDAADHVTFTGSSAAGRRIAERAGRNLITCSLELGGKNPMIVLEDADLDAAVQSALQACFIGAGQTCLSIERIVVVRPRCQPFLDALVAGVAALRMKPDLGWSVDVGSLTSKRQFDRVVAHVEDARAKGAKVLAGGRGRPDLGPYFYEPTVLTAVTPDMLLYREETFGPVVAVYPVADEKAAVALADDTAYGLSASIWSADVNRARRLATRLHCGAVNINDGFAAAQASYDAPMGGLRASGLGHRHGATGLLTYTDTQTVASQHHVSLSPDPNQDRRRYLRTLTTTFATMKRLRLR